MAHPTPKLHPAAIEDAQAAKDWYAEHNVAIAQAFVDELDRAMGLIATRPHQFPTYTGGARRYLLHRFPYMVVFREVGDDIEVIAVAHARRRPGYWRSRLP